MIRDPDDNEDKGAEVEENRVFRDAFEVGCGGLIGGWATQRETGKRVNADQVRKVNGPFYCGECFGDVVHRYCHEIRHHFAHTARLSPVVSAKESILHKECKNAIYEDLRAKFPESKWVCDNVTIPPIRERKLCALRPDIGGTIDGKRLAIEVQASALTIPRILKRSLAYAARKISILWVVPLSEPIGQREFRPRLFERYLHSIYFGRTYYWYPGMGSMVQPVHYGLAWRTIPISEWFEDGEQRTAGGYEVPYKRIRKPAAHEPIPISEEFYHRDRDEHRPWNERKTVPAMRIFLDKLPQWWDSREEEILNRQFPDNEPDDD